MCVCVYVCVCMCVTYRSCIYIMNISYIIEITCGINQGTIFRSSCRKLA